MFRGSFMLWGRGLFRQALEEADLFIGNVILLADGEEEGLEGIQFGIVIVAEGTAGETGIHALPADHIAHEGEVVILDAFEDDLGTDLLQAAGGLDVVALNGGVVRALERELGVSITVSPIAQLGGAFGAAIYGRRKIS